MTTAIIFIIILAILVFVHELGHFLAAKAAKVRVDTFAIGFPPRIFSKKIGETEYALNAIPFGGYVSIHGESYDGITTEENDKNRSLVYKNRAVQVGVFAAGVCMNVLFAWGLLSVGFIGGLPTSVEGTKYTDRVTDARLLITGIRPESPAMKAGLLTGDEILYLESGEDGITPTVSNDISGFIAPRAGEEVVFLVKRGDERLMLQTRPEEGIVPVDASLGEVSRGAVGISIDVVGTLHLPIHLAVVEGATATYIMARDTVVGLKQFLWEVVRGKADLASVTGPVGIASVVGEVRELGFAYLVTFTAFISINLAVLNLLPFPALDGGRILFVTAEAITRRRIPVKFAQMANFVGFALLMVLMVVITYRDIVRLVAS